LSRRRGRCGYLLKRGASLQKVVEERLKAAIERRGKKSP